MKTVFRGGGAAARQAQKMMKAAEKERLFAEDVDDDSENDDDDLSQDEDMNGNEDAADREELRIALSKGLLSDKVILDKKKPAINNEGRLTERYMEIRQIEDPKTFPWIERMDITSDVPIVIEDVHDDLKREMSFYNQALQAALQGYKKIETAGVKIRRPSDYFAETIKTDDHMRRVRESLLSEKQAIERSELAKKTRQMKRFGKQVQLKVLEDRQKTKTQELDAIKKFRKDRSSKPEFLQGDEDDAQFNISVSKDRDLAQKRSGDQSASPHKRRKDDKFGYGGKKRGSKRNTRESASDMSQFNAAKNKQLPPGMKAAGIGPRKKTGKTPRAGKSKRTQMKQRK